MLRTDAEALFRKIRQLWPTWQPSDELAAFWVRRLERYDDPVVLGKAIEDHKANTTWGRPTLKGIAMEFERIVGGQMRPADEQGHGATGVFIQCVEALRRAPQQLGWYIPVIYGNDSAVPDPDTVLRHAEAMAIRHGRLYGGVWQVVRDSDDAQMDAAGRRLRAEAKAST